MLATMTAPLLQQSNTQVQPPPDPNNPHAATLCNTNTHTATEPIRPLVPCNTTSTEPHRLGKATTDTVGTVSDSGAVVLFHESSTRDALSIPLVDPPFGMRSNHSTLGAKHSMPNGPWAWPRSNVPRADDTTPTVKLESPIGDHLRTHTLLDTRNHHDLSIIIPSGSVETDYEGSSGSVSCWIRARKHTHHLYVLAPRQTAHMRACSLALTTLPLLRLSRRVVAKMRRWPYRTCCYRFA